MFICKDKRIETALEPHYSLSVIDDKHSIIAFEGEEQEKSYKVELLIQQSVKSYFFNSKQILTQARVLSLGLDWSEK